MRIRYKKKQVNLILNLGLLWLVNGIFQIVFNENPKEIHYYWFVLSGLHLIIYFYQKKGEYLTIENGIIKQNWPFGKKINLDEVKSIRHFAGEYILKSESQKMKIDIQLIDEESLPNLKAELKKLNVEWN